MVIDWLRNRLLRGHTGQRSSEIDNTTLIEAGELMASGETAAAEVLVQQLLAREPQHCGALLKLAEIYIGKHEYDAARNQLEKLSTICPRSFEVSCYLGKVYAVMGRYNQAILRYKEALGFNARSSEAYLGLGDVYENAGNIQEALHAYMQSNSLNPSAYANIKIANRYTLDGDHVNAVRYYLQALEYDTDNPEIYRSLGSAYRLLGKYDEAGEALAKSLDLDPHDGIIHKVLGLYYLDTGYPNKARKHFLKSIELGEDDIKTRHNLCAVFQAQGEYLEAMQCYSELYNRTNDVVARWNHGLLQLMTGDFSHGWVEYENRHNSMICGTRAFKYPIWNGEDVSDKTILIYGEQGIGDEIMFSSCLQDISKQAGRCILECDERLATLFARSFPDVQVHGSARILPDTEQCQLFRNTHKAVDIDYQVPVGSLPLHFRQSVNDFPQHSGYLHADPLKVVKWHQCLQSLGEGPKIGISWRGGVPQTRRYLRSIPLTDWLPVLSMPGFNFVSLQYSDCSDEIAALSHKHGITLQHWPEANSDLDEAAALISALDLVISVQTTVVHLTGALGRPAWVLVPYSPEWRYMASGKHLPWYPSITLMRQQALRDWSGVIQQVSDQLAHQAGNGKLHNHLLI